MSDSFKLSVFSPVRKLIEGESVRSLVLFSVEGEIEILPGHADMVSSLDTGSFLVTPVSGEPVQGVISSGFVRVENGEVKVLAETIELAQEIDLSRAAKAQALAEKMLSDASLDSAQFRKYQLKLQRAIIRQRMQ